MAIAAQGLTRTYLPLGSCGSGILGGVGDGPSDAELLEAGGWAGVPSVRILARAADGDFCAAVVNTADGDESNPYATIVECFDRQPDGTWRSLGHHGPIVHGEGSGSFNGRWNYEYGWSEASRSWWVVALDES